MDNDGTACVEHIGFGASDSGLVAAMTEADKTGIDCPLGWPVKFIEFISTHQRGHVAIEPGSVPADWRRELAYRVTDLRVKQLPGIQGLSVSTDRIGITTMRCAALMAGLAELDRPVDRTGAGPVVEVYPAASLVQWGLPHKGYKKKEGRANLNALVDQLQDDAPWLKFDEFEELCRTSDDAFDAVVSALTARAASCALVEPIPPPHSEVAAVEGWIALPNTQLAALVTQATT